MKATKLQQETAKIEASLSKATQVLAPIATIPLYLAPHYADRGMYESRNKDEIVESDDLRVTIDTVHVSFVLESHDQVRINERGDWVIWRFVDAREDEGGDLIPSILDYSK